MTDIDNVDRRERAGLETVLAGLTEGLSLMPAGCGSYRSLLPLMVDLEHWLQDPTWPARGARRQSPRDAGWRSLSSEGREALVLDVLGDDALIKREIRARLDAHLSTPGDAEFHAVDEGDITTVVRRLLLTGQVERVAELMPNSTKKIRYRYARRRPLEGSIVDLERAFHEDSGEASS